MKVIEIGTGPASKSAVEMLIQPRRCLYGRDAGSLFGAGNWQRRTREVISVTGQLLVPSNQRLVATTGRAAVNKLCTLASLPCALVDFDTTFSRCPYGPSVGCEGLEAAFSSWGRGQKEATCKTRGLRDLFSGFSQSAAAHVVIGVGFRWLRQPDCVGVRGTQR